MFNQHLPEETFILVLVIIILPIQMAHSQVIFEIENLFAMKEKYFYFLKLIKERHMSIECLLVYRWWMSYSCQLLLF